MLISSTLNLQQKESTSIPIGRRTCFFLERFRVFHPSTTKKPLTAGIFSEETTQISDPGLALFASNNALFAPHESGVRELSGQARREVFGHESFRPGQMEAVLSLHPGVAEGAEVLLLCRWFSREWKRFAEVLTTDDQILP